MRIVVTGGAGFVGSNLVDALLAAGHRVVAVDSFATGRHEFLTAAADDPRFELVTLDLAARPDGIVETIDGADAVVHLAANADVRFGWDHSMRDLEQNVIVTHHVLEAMRSTGVRRLVFSSTGSVYGEAVQIPTPETCPFPVQTSLYGASKAAAEGFIAAYSEIGVVSATVLRFVGLLGPRYTHGHVIDFAAQLTAHPDHLRVLGDGTQRKAYLHVSDCVDAIVQRLDEEPTFEVFNLGRDDYCQVKDSVGWICERMGVQPEVRYSGGDRGWVGDNPFIWLDTAAIRSTGWVPRWGIRASVEDTVDWLLANPWALDAAITDR